MSYERERKVTCRGVAEYYDDEKYWIGGIEDVDPVEVVLKRGKHGVTEIFCPFHCSKQRNCTRIGELPYKHGRNVIFPICKFSPAASHESYEIATPAFKEKNFFEKVWERLTPQAKTACLEMEPYAFYGMSNSSFKGMCYAFQIGINPQKQNEFAIDPDKLIDELTEGGVLEEMSFRDVVDMVLKQIEKGEVEDSDVREWLEDGDSEKLEAIKARLQKDLTYLDENGDFSEDARGYEDDPELFRDSLKRVQETLRGPHLRFAPGFQTFINQFRNQSGFPIRFDKSRLIDKKY